METDELSRRRQKVAHVCRVRGVSERRACRVIGQPRSTQRRTPRAPEERLIADIIDLATTYGRYCYRRSCHWSERHCRRAAQRAPLLYVSRGEQKDGSMAMSPQRQPPTLGPWLAPAGAPGQARRSTAMARARHLNDYDRRCHHPQTSNPDPRSGASQLTRAKASLQI